tara:strand:- start:3578 stop:4366 length:789 start_codon:yes stop_codon:yes gene_type:complete
MSRRFRLFSRDSAYTPTALPLSITPEEIATNYLRPTDKEITEAVIPINLQGKKPCKPKPKPNTYLLVKDAFNNPFDKNGGTRKRRKRKKKKNRRKTRNKKGGYRRIIIEYNKILLSDIKEWVDRINKLYKKEINHFNSLKKTQLIVRKAKNMGRQEAKPTSVDDIKQLFSRFIARMMAFIIKKKNRNNNKIQQINNDHNAGNERLDKKSLLEIENNDLDQTLVELERILLDGKWGGKKRRKRKRTKKKRKRRRSTKKKKRRR